MRISVIVTTYNQPVFLAQVLRALAQQDTNGYEVLVADDGSDARTQECIQKIQADFPVRLVHVWQEDQGFRAARARNKAVAQAVGAYVVFLDGDCVPRHRFIRQHRHCAESGFLVAGHRILLSRKFTERVLREDLKIAAWALWQWWWVWLRESGCNRIFSLSVFPWNILRKRARKKWQGVKTCNMGVWMRDFVAVQGFNEAYVGWGYEDSDLVIRLMQAGIGRKSGRFAVSVLHLWHPEQSRTHQSRNADLLRKVQETSCV